jgi:hypothetical protein
VDHPDREYWQRLFCPWVHYVPIRRDLRDLDAAVARLQHNASLAMAIAQQGQAQARRVFSHRAVETVAEDSLLHAVLHW